MSILIRKAEHSDSKDIFSWRNDDLSLSMFRDSNIVLWDEHSIWFEERINNKNYLFLIGEKNNTKIGVIRFDVYKNYSEVSVNLNPEQRGKNLSRNFLALSCNYYFNLLDKKIISEIKNINTKSLKIFESVGFNETGNKENFICYELRKNNLIFKA